jgi:hypothetical protein
MGSSFWSDDVYTQRQAVRAQTKAQVFQHDQDVRTGKVQTALHEALDPSKMKGGVREARDSKEHPNSVPILFALDETGSMASVPRLIQSKLGKLMSTILTKGYLADPQIAFMAIGDAHTGHTIHDREKAPCQIGQFEAGLEMEDDLTRFYLEGNGGGQGMESYDLALYFAAYRTRTDAWEKRQRKGYLFITGDERTYPSLDADTIHRVFGGERPDKNYPIRDLVAAASERYHIFFIIPGGANGAGNADLHDHWVGLLGKDHVIHLDDPNQVCDVVALTIGLTEGTATASAASENVAPEIKSAIDPIIAATKTKVADAKASGGKTARL